VRFAGDERDRIGAEREHGAVGDALAPGDLDAPELREVPEVDPGAGSLDVADVDETVPLDRREEDLLAQRADPDVGGAPRVERAGRPRRAQQRALLAGGEEVQQHGAVRGHGHVSSRGRVRTSAAHGGRPAQGRRGEAVRARGQV
jgi:hypothetical protein